MTDPQEQTGVEGYRFSRDPWGQALLTGALTLIPARTYPRWLRHMLMWGLPAAVTVALSVGAARPQVLANLSERFKGEDGATEEGAEASQQRAGEAQVEDEAPPLLMAKRALAGLLTGAAVGTTLAGVMTGGLWADEKIDRSLRRLHIPVPRVVMGITAGLVTWYQVTREERAAVHDGVGTEL